MPSADRRAAIVVTRSEPGAAALVEALHRAGFATIRLPVLDVVAVADSRCRQVLAELDHYDTSIFISRHAVRFGVPLIESLWPKRPPMQWIAVGAATARALAERGIEARKPAHESSEGILALPQLRRATGMRALIFAGRGGRSLLADELRQRGASVERLELYERRPLPVELAAPPLEAAGGVGAVVVGSVEGARAFAAIWNALGRDRSVSVFAPSPRVVSALRELGFERAVDCGGADVDSVVATLMQRMGRRDE